MRPRYDTSSLVADLNRSKRVGLVFFIVITLITIAALYFFYYYSEEEQIGPTPQTPKKSLAIKPMSASDTKTDAIASNTDKKEVKNNSNEKNTEDGTSLKPIDSKQPIKDDASKTTETNSEIKPDQKKKVKVTFQVKRGMKVLIDGKRYKPKRNKIVISLLPGKHIIKTKKKRKKWKTQNLTIPKKKKSMTAKFSSKKRKWALK